MSDFDPMLDKVATRLADALKANPAPEGQHYEFADTIATYQGLIVGSVQAKLVDDPAPAPAPAKKPAK